MQIPQLDERLHAAFDLFDTCTLGADIAADHAHLACALLTSGKCNRMIVSDISPNSLQRAEQLFGMHGLLGKAELRLADGFSAIHSEENASCAALLGVGGSLMSKLLIKAGTLHLPSALVLSANTDLPLVRKTLSNIDYSIINERVVRAKHRFYVVMRAERGRSNYSERQLYLGPVLLEQREALWYDYLLWREGVVAREDGHKKQLAWIQEELKRE